METVKYTPTANQTAQKIILTPEVAEQILQTNTFNRPPKRDNLARLEKCLRNGEWRFNGDAIRIAEDGVVLDGQHRCMAVKNTGVPVETLVITGLPREVFMTIDTGSPRTKSDTLSILGEQTSTTLAAALAIINQIVMTGDAARTITLSNSEIIMLLERYPEARVGPDYKISRLATPSVVRAMHFLFSRSNEAKSDEFFKSLTSGLGLDAVSPIYQLRQRLIGNATSKNKMKTRQMCAIFIKAWNLYLAGRTCHVLTFRETGEAPETFPKVD